MRILKYLFLLALLLLVGTAVYIATQKSTFDVTVEKNISTPIKPVFNYVSDYRNWPEWTFGIDAKYQFSSFTSGKGGSFTFDSASEGGTFSTLQTQENVSITQRYDSGGFVTDSNWKFFKTSKGTRIVWNLKGEMSFMSKVRAALSGGPNEVMKEKYSAMLERLKKTIDREINAYKIEIDGVVAHPGQFYIGQKITSSIENAPRNIRIMLSRVNHFFTKNKIASVGKSFILYDTFDAAKGITRFTVCVPIAEEVHIMPGSDMISGQIGSFSALKTTLKGDHSHLKEAWDKSFAHISANNLQETDGSYLEVFKISLAESNRPSKWVTEIYIPVAAPAPVATPVPVVAAKPVEAPPAEDPMADGITIP